MTIAPTTVSSLFEKLLYFFTQSLFALGPRPSIEDFSVFRNHDCERSADKFERIGDLHPVVESDRKTKTIGLNKFLNLGLPVSDKNTNKLNIFDLKRPVQFFYSRSLLLALGSIRSHKF